ncbi:RhoGAP-domain-containing protein [Artomyces pyxidatus]|uniref:RhoGAP-domain-containing protein n=1 Tax=Artomyces pyxidatus TaxID=48021 RepID=A0ACB8SMX9_9AGAM|nr:RhoGAP-domain-containing protein [Artomyces pyxidatus]
MTYDSSNSPSSLPYQSRVPDRPTIPTRASTLGSAQELEHNRFQSEQSSTAHARSEDLNHSGSFAAPSPAFLSPSRPTTPGSSSNNHNPPSSSGHSDQSGKRLSITSSSSAYSASSTSAPDTRAPASSTSIGSSSTSSSICSSCGQVIQGAFVRALGTTFHLNCFKCMDCGDVVASKFFPIDGHDGKQQPLCERDYFRRLNLICAKCGMALRGSYITACNKKFHVEHFTCSICTTLFGPQDSYYEHDSDVYCHYHYSTRFATKCAGCNTAILKQFVEINRNMRDECWHPECYMINKFWNVKVVSRRPTSLQASTTDASEPPYLEEERVETHSSLKDKQVKMEQQVYRIWTVLSAFEESSAACISDMLRQVSNGQYLEAIRMAEKFILHVEVLFATIDDLEYHFARLNLKGMSHVREARMLCRKTVDLFTLLSHTQETGARRMGMTQELLALVTGLAHYLKILIRIALTGALKLEREYDVREAMSSFLDKLHLLAVQGGNPSARRMMKGAKGEVTPAHRPGTGNASTNGVSYGFRSLAPENAGESPFIGTPRDPALSNIPVVNPPSDLCVKCNLTVEEDCVRLGTYQRWHSHCIQCGSCGKAAAAPLPQEPKAIEDKEKSKTEDGLPKITTVRRPPANVDIFLYELDSIKDTASFGAVPTVIYCSDHAHQGCRPGFQAVSRLEQYAFLLNVALRRLYLLLKKRKVIPLTPGQYFTLTVQREAHEPLRTAVTSTPAEEEQDPYRNSGDIMRMKTVHLDRKLSATARLPKRSTIVESPSGKVAHPTDVVTSQSRPHHTDGGSTSHGHRPHIHGAASTNGRSHRGAHGHTQQQQPQPPPMQQQPQQTPQRPPRPQLAISSQPDLTKPRPSFNRANTDVMIVDDSAPSSPAGPPPDGPVGVEGITLADIPQLAEAAQAREQHRSLPSQSSIPYIAELTPLELAIVKHAAVVILYRSPLREQIDVEEIMEMVEVKKQGFWNKLFKGNDKKNVKKKGVFGVPLELLAEREGADSMHGASRTTLRVPSFIDDVVSAMRQMDMSVEGIFRKNGNIRRLKDLTEAIDRDPSSVDLTTDNAVQLAALLKKFLRDLPDPLLTFKLHRLLLASQTLPNESERKRLLHMLALILPKSHRDTMEVLFVFLKWVASFAHMDEQTGSKMDLPNLATVICPSILYSPGRDPLRDDSFGAIRVVTALLENQDEFYTVPEEFMSLLHDQEYFAHSMELPSKDFVKKCETYMRLKANGRMPGPAMSPVANSMPFHSNNANLAHLARPTDSQDSRLGPAMSRSPDRPGMPPSSMSENVIRNGYQSRQQSPQPTLPHSAMSFPSPGQQPPNSLSQGVAMIQSPQPQPRYANGNGSLSSDSEWNAQRSPPPPLQSGSRPSSAAFSRPGGGEQTPQAHSFASSANGYGPPPNGSSSNSPLHRAPA